LVTSTGLVTTVFSILSLLASADDADDGPLRVRVQLAPGTHYVGESLTLTVSVAAEAERPKLTIPRTADAEITLVETDLRPISASGIGDVVETRNLFRYHYRLLAKRSGTLEVPPVTARLGDRSGSTGPLRFKVKDPPIEQRPKEFLGGVGTFDLKAEADPSAVRLGQTLEYRIRLTGPAARSSRNGPALSRLSDLPTRPEVEALEPELVADPPSRVFRYRIRPTRAGDVVLPPVAIAAFDPRIARYVTKVTQGVPIRVADVPTFTSADLQYGPPPEPDAVRRSNAQTRSGYVGLGLIVAAVVLLCRLAFARRLRVSRARAAAARRARDLPADGPSEEVARWIAEGLVEYLGLTLGRPAGALTPREAEEGIGAATAEYDLAVQSGRLVELCDRTCYGSGGPSSETLAAEAQAVFVALAERDVHATRLRKTERGSPDRAEG